MATKSKPKSKRPPARAKAPASPYATQIGSESALRFGPEESALQAALSDAISQHDSEVAAAHGAAQGAIRTAQLARPGVQAITNDVLGQIDQAIATQTPGTTSDLARTRTRLAERMALATTDLTSRQTSAAEGEQYAVNAAAAREADSRTKIFDRLKALGGEVGAYAQGRAAELAGDDADRQQQVDIANAQNATSLASAGVNPDGTIVSGGPKDPAANGKTADQQERDRKQAAAERAKTLASPDEHEAAVMEINRAKKIAETLKGKGLSRRQAAEYLLATHPAAEGKQVYDDVPDGRGGTKREPRIDPKTGVTVTTTARPEIAAVQPRWASVALDLAFDGGVSAANVRRLHNPRKRYSVKELGLVTQTQRRQSGELAPVGSSTSQLTNGPGR